MTDESHDHEHDLGAEPVTDKIHDNSWSANLEKPEHAEEQELVIKQGIEAIEHTAEGNHVNLVTHANHGYPEEFLFEELENAFDDIEWEYIQQCGCGGHVVRVHV